MFRKLLVANRGEIAVRAFRAAYELGLTTVAVFPYEDRNSVHRLVGRRVLPDRRAGPSGSRLPVGRGDHQGGPEGRRGRDLPGLRLPFGEPRSRRGLRAGRHHFVGPPKRGAGPDRQQVPRGGRGPGGRPAGAAARRPSADADDAARRRRRRRLPAVRQGRRRRRRARDAPGRRAGPSWPSRSTPRCARRESAFGTATVFLEQAVVGPAAHRGADRRRRRRATSRTSTSGTARCSGGTRR